MHHVAPARRRARRGSRVRAPDEDDVERSPAPSPPAASASARPSPATTRRRRPAPALERRGGRPGAARRVNPVRPAIQIGTRGSCTPGAVVTAAAELRHRAALQHRHEHLDAGVERRARALSSAAGSSNSEYSP